MPTFWPAKTVPRSLLVVDVQEAIDALLLLEEVHAGWLGSLFLERQMRARGGRSARGGRAGCAHERLSEVISGALPIVRRRFAMRHQPFALGSF
jgi:hypothetical protein